MALLGSCQNFYTQHTASIYLILLFCGGHKKYGSL
jgi:hypothetical protein